MAHSKKSVDQTTAQTINSSSSSSHSSSSSGNNSTSQNDSSSARTAGAAVPVSTTVMFKRVSAPTSEGELQNLDLNVVSDVRHLSAYSILYIYLCVCIYTYIRKTVVL